MYKTESNMVSEQDIIKGCKAGEKSYQKDLYKRFAAKMFGVCLRYCNTREDAEDVLQEGFVKIFQKIDMFRNEGSFEGWMRRVFVNTALQSKIKNVKFQNNEHIENIADLPQSEADSLSKISQQDLLNEIKKMPEGYKVVFNMYAIEGYSHKEIADALEISESTSRTQFFRARNFLQNIIINKLKYER